MTNKVFDPQVGDTLTINSMFEGRRFDSKFRAGDEFRVDTICKDLDNEPIVYATCIGLGNTESNNYNNRIERGDSAAFVSHMPVYPYLIVSDKKAPPATMTETIQQRMAKKRALAAKCSYYYPIMQRDEHGTQQVAAAETPEGAATIKAAMEHRNPDAHFDIGPKSIVFSDELILLEFEPNEAERIELKQKKRALQAACREVEHPTPEWIRQIVGGTPK